MALPGGALYPSQPAVGAEAWGAVVWVMHICHVALAWLWLGPLLNPAELLSSLIRGLHHAPVSLGKRWLSSWEPSGEERGRNCVLAGVELSAHKYTHEGAGWKSFKSCFVSLDEGGGCESLVWMC